MIQTTENTIRIKANPEAMNLDDSTRFYRYEIGQVDLLSSEEVTRLAQRIERGKAGKRQRSNATPRPLREVEDAAEAKRQLIEANLRLVLHVARKYKGFGVDLMDLVQEGNLGLMHAVEKFDYRKGYKFSTYATWWIRQYITRALAEQASMIRVPLYKVEEMKRLGRARRRLQQEGIVVGEPTLEDLANQMESACSKSSLCSQQIRRQSVWICLARVVTKKSSLSDILEDDPCYSPERVVISQTLHDQIHDLLDDLTIRERRVLQLRYGLNGGSEHSLTETGKKLGLSHEAVRQVEFRALRKLDHPCRTRMLQDFLG